MMVVKVELIEKTNLDVNDIPCEYGEYCRLDTVEQWINEQPVIVIPEISDAHDLIDRGVAHEMLLQGYDMRDVPPARTQGTCYTDSEGYERCSVCNKHETAMQFFRFCPHCGSELV